LRGRSSIRAAGGIANQDAPAFDGTADAVGYALDERWLG
jgi:hypothetical protein